MCLSAVENGLRFGGESAEAAGVSRDPGSLGSGGKPCWVSGRLLGLTHPPVTTVFPDLTLTGSEVNLAVGEVEIIVWIEGQGWCQDKRLHRHFEINQGAGERAGVSRPAPEAPEQPLNSGSTQMESRKSSSYE